MHPSAYIRSGWNLLDFIIVIVGYFVYFIKSHFASTNVVLLVRKVKCSGYFLTLQVVQCDGRSNDRSQARWGPPCCRKTWRPGCQSSPSVQSVTTTSTCVWSAKCVNYNSFCWDISMKWRFALRGGKDKAAYLFLVLSLFIIFNILFFLDTF